MRVNPFNGYKYLIYRIYDWQKSLFGEKENPRFTAVLVVSSFLTVNLVTVDLILAFLTGRRTITTAFQVLVPSFVLASINSYYFLHMGKFESLIEIFANESEASRRRNTRFCWAYIIVTHALALVLASFWSGPAR